MPSKKPPRSKPAAAAPGRPPLRPYRGAGKSGVAAYAFGPDFIVIQFADDKGYRYNHRRPGRTHVAAMKELATAGQGLATYINQHVREAYAERLW